MHLLGGYFVPVMVLMVVIAILVAVAMVSKRYIRIGPNRCAVIYGRKRTIVESDAAGKEIRRKIGFRTLCGGATFIWPIVEKYSELDLTEKNIAVSTANAITEGGVKLSVDAIANVKIGSDDVSLRNAAERLLGKSEGDIETIIQKTLDAHLRSICGNLTIEKINSDRQAFTQKVTSEAAEDLRKLGIIIDNISIEHLNDDQGYLEALGKKRTEEVKRDASIGVFEAQREATIKSTNAHREGEIERQNNLAQEAEAEKNRNVKVKAYEAEVATAAAKAGQAGPLAEAEAKQGVIRAQVKVREVETEAEIAVQEKEIEKEQKAQYATTVVPAEAAANAQVKKADGQKKAAIAEAEGLNQATILRADAEAHKREVEGHGLATATEATGLAEAKVIQAKGAAEAEVNRLKLLAEAEGLAKKAEAYKQLPPAAIILELVKELPPAIDAFAAVMGNVASPMGNIDKVIVYDNAGNSDGKGSSLSRFAMTGPLMMNQLLESAKAAGFDLTKLFELAKIQVGTPEVKPVGKTRPSASSK